MKGEINIGGVFLPCLLMIAVGAFIVTAILKKVLRRVEFYRFVWHSGLFDVALYALAMWSVAIITSSITP
ncbi:DUF1656 domain-containing protein [Dyella flava]|uniref:DUF1656 domain-containing protein n=1 Tax=Dyella flava TaxID=1920170 RepID=A0ABS2K1J7_9GAMM|nr:DUF1656 domain-containing protein [Dyella flava]MBM7125026.1 DUF1656 domain-containing protein [Dyella flava]GLQ49983.1 hypothetical protein GCM10010872_14320 [Dyella flava]